MNLENRLDPGLPEPGGESVGEGREPTGKLESWARSLAFDLVGVARALPGIEEERYREWLGLGYHAEMEYLERSAERRVAPAQVLPGVRSVIMLGVAYGPARSRTVAKLGGRIARYAQGDDYHDVLLPRVRELEDRIRSRYPGATSRGYVDTGPILEKVWAQRAGLGWIGKNACLITPRFGSWVLLASILTTVEFEPSDPHPMRCGTCNDCVPACPTGAIVEPQVVDSRRCISYTTIEHRGPIPEEMRADTGDWLFGCDVCQEVCPWNRDYTPGTLEALMAREPISSITADDLIGLEEEAWWKLRRNSPIARPKRRGMVRNASVVLANRGDAGAVEGLIRALADPDPVIRAEAVAGLKRVGSERALEAIRAHLEREKEALVRAEFEGSVTDERSA